MNENKLLKLNKMDRSFNYKRPCRTLSTKELIWIKKYCDLTNPNKPVIWPDCVNECLFTNFPCNCTEDMIIKHNNELIDQYLEITKQSLTFMNKTDFQNNMKKISKKIGEYFLPYVWITISPKKFENKIDNIRISMLLDKCLREYFYQDFRKCDKVHWVLEFGADGRHAHSHILCQPKEEHQKSFVKNFGRDFTTLWKKKILYNNKYIDILNLKSIAFKCSTLRRPEFIDDKLKYMNNETKGPIHDNPHDEDMFAMLNMPKKYEGI